MAFTIAGITIGNEVMLYAFLALIPFFLIYLIRPRPKRLNIPSLMFFMKATGVARFRSFLRNFIRDWLFIIQLLILLGLIGALLSPFYFYDHDITAQNTVIVLDVSASSQVKEGSITRFEIAQSKAKSLLGERNTVVLAKQIPLIGIQDVSSFSAAKYISDLIPRDTPTRLGDAIILAGETLAGKEGRVIVLSDFINTGGQNPETAKLVLESKGLVVDFINLAGEYKPNVGIVDLIVNEDTTVAYIKNFGNEQTTVSLEIGDIRKDITLSAGHAEPFAFATPKGVTTLRIIPDDAFPLDNTVYISGLPEERVKVLLITNTKSIFLENALRATPFMDVSIATPPIVKIEGYDMFVLHNLDPNEILPGTMEDIYSAVQDGATLILHAQEGMNEIEYKGLLPYTIEGFVNQGSVIVAQQTHFTRNIDFGLVTQAHNLAAVQPLTMIASVNDAPIISFGNMGDGKIFYYGILESASNFRLSPSYPIFWNELLKFLTDREDVRSINFKTDKVLILDHPEVIKTPKETVRQSTLLMEYSGPYKVGDNSMVANLINERESNINFEGTIAAPASDYQLHPVKEQRKRDLETILIIAASIILLLELIYIKMRGDV